MRNGGRVVDESGRSTRLAGSTPLCSGSTPLSPRANTNVNGANTPATLPSSNDRYMGSPSRQRHRSVTGCARLSASTPKTRTGKREAVNSGARVRVSGGGSGKKRIRSRARALPRVRLQTQVEERLAEAEFDVQQTQARKEALLRKEQANAEADAEARRKAVSTEPGPGLERQTRGGKRVGKESTYIYVNRVFEAIRDQRDGSESAWPPTTFQGWSPDENEKARLFVLAYLLAGCDFLPAISGLGFERMWACALKSVRAGGIFDSSIFVQDNGVWNVDIEGCVKLLATIFYFKYESSFKDVCESPGELLLNLNGKVDEYVKCICFVILKFGTARATSVCPPYESMRLQCLRANAVLGYWQDGCKKPMPPRDFKDQGWGVDPTLKNSASLDLTKENCVMWLSEHSYIGSDNKTKTLACKDCRPPTNGRPINCQRCRCHRDGRKCSLSCGCRGTCNERRFAKPAAASPAQPATVPARPAAPPTPAAASNAPPTIHNTIAGALRAMMATRAAAAAAAAEAAAAAAAEAAASAPAEVPPGASEDNAPVAQKEVELPEDDPDRIPDWLSDASGTSDASSDVNSDGGSDGGWAMSLEDGSDEAEWVPGDGEAHRMEGWHVPESATGAHLHASNPLRKANLETTS